MPGGIGVIPLGGNLSRNADIIVFRQHFLQGSDRVFIHTVGDLAVVFSGIGHLFEDIVDILAQNFRQTGRELFQVPLFVDQIAFLILLGDILINRIRVDDDIQAVAL